MSLRVEDIRLTDSPGSLTFLALLPDQCVITHVCFDAV